MELRERIAGWSRWPGWRRYAPAAGSLVAHLFIGMAVFAMLAATGKPLPMGVRVPLRQLEVTLVAETPPPRGIRPTPPDAPKAPPRSDPKSVPLPSAPPVKRDPSKDQKQQQAAAAPAIAGGAKSDEEGGVYLGNSVAARSGVPLGLRSLLETDPCKPEKGLPRGDCGLSWKERLAQSHLLEKPTARQLQAMYPGIVLPCRFKVGCDGLPEGKLNNGTRSVFNSRGSPMMSGAGGLGGINELTERLGFNPDHTDPGFGD